MFHSSEEGRDVGVCLVVYKFGNPIQTCLPFFKTLFLSAGRIPLFAIRSREASAFPCDYRKSN